MWHIFKINKNYWFSIPIKENNTETDAWKLWQTGILETVLTSGYGDAVSVLTVTSNDVTSYRCVASLPGTSNTVEQIWFPPWTGKLIFIRPVLFGLLLLLNCSKTLSTDVPSYVIKMYLFVNMSFTVKSEKRYFYKYTRLCNLWHKIL